MKTKVFIFSDPQVFVGVLQIKEDDVTLQYFRENPDGSSTEIEDSRVYEDQIDILYAKALHWCQANNININKY